MPASGLLSIESDLSYVGSFLGGRFSASRDYPDPALTNEHQVPQLCNVLVAISKREDASQCRHTVRCTTTTTTTSRLLSQSTQRICCSVNDRCGSTTTAILMSLDLLRGSVLTSRKHEIAYVHSILSIYISKHYLRDCDTRNIISSMEMRWVDVILMKRAEASRGVIRGGSASLLPSRPQSQTTTHSPPSSPSPMVTKAQNQSLQLNQGFY